MAEKSYYVKKRKCLYPLSHKEEELMRKHVFVDEDVDILQSQMCGGFSMSFGKIQHVFMYKITDWRKRMGFDNSKTDKLSVPKNKWVDYQMESMFKDW